MSGERYEPRDHRGLAIAIGSVAVLAALAGLVTASRPPLVVASLLAALLVAWQVFERVTRTPYDVRGRLPRALSRRAGHSLGDRPYLGLCRGRLGRRRFAFGTPEDSTALVGTPTVGKTGGVMIPQGLLWGGAWISTSTLPDVFRATAALRLQLARAHGGDVYIYDPMASGLVEGLRPVRWSPLDGCRDQRVAGKRVDSIVGATRVAKGVEDENHWREGAKQILRPYFLAAAHDPVRAGDFAVVREWLDAEAFDEPLAILRGLRTLEGDQWAGQLEGVRGRPEKERGSFFSAAATAIVATSYASVLRSCSTTEIDPEKFVLTRSTLYVLSAAEDQDIVAPFNAALIESIVSATYRLHREGRLDTRLLLGLDELNNIAPLPTLQRIVSQGRGQGVIVTWAAHSRAQLRGRFGADADAIWAATKAKVIFGGSTDDPMLQELERAIGDVKTMVHSQSVVAGKWQKTKAEVWRPRLSVAELRRIPSEWALLLYHSEPPYVLRVPIAKRVRQLWPALLPWEAPSAAPAPAPIRLGEPEVEQA